MFFLQLWCYCFNEIICTFVPVKFSVKQKRNLLLSTLKPSKKFLLDEFYPKRIKLLFKTCLAVQKQNNQINSTCSHFIVIIIIVLVPISKQLHHTEHIYKYNSLTISQ